MAEGFEARKRKMVERVKQLRDEGRPIPFAGFAFAATKALLEAHPHNEGELFLRTINAEKPPTHCPLCHFAVSAPVRVRGAWTWNCAGGCNP